MIDYKFLESLEGFEVDGYVPDPEGSQSGVTLASGVDLGQHSASDLVEIGVPAGLCARLEPYCGLKKEEALRALGEAPLRVTPEEARTLNEAVKARALRALESAWNAASDVSWDELGDVKQTVVLSVAYQYGNLARACPNFWRQVTTGAWDEAYANLMDFGDAYKTRRKKEAAYLMQG